MYPRTPLHPVPVRLTLPLSLQAGEERHAAQVAELDATIKTMAAEALVCLHPSTPTPRGRERERERESERARERERPNP